MKKPTLIFCCFYFSFLLKAQPVILTIKINGQNRNDSIKAKHLTLKALEDDLVFDFTPEVVDSFDFLLENYDGKTVKTAFPTIRYTHLQGGKYTLHYWSEKNNIPSDKGQFYLLVEESLTEAWWFYPTVVSCVVILLSVIAYFWSIYDLRQKVKLEMIRNRIAKDLHDEIGSDLGSIVLSIGTTKRKFGKNEAELSLKLDEIKEAMQNTATNLRDTVWIIEPKNDSLPILFDKIKTFSKRILTAVNVALIFENNMATDEVFTISMAQRRAVYLILREAVHNIAKHAKASQASIHIKREPEGLLITVSDNGIGFDPSVKTSDGNGLKNFVERAEESHIEFALNSTPSVGTMISLRVPEL